MSSERDTIFALSSGHPPAAIAVVRISGPRAGHALKVLTGKIPQPRAAHLARVRGADGEIIDQALALWFPGPHSETGEDVAELQLHGGRAVIAAVLAVLGKIEGLRPAEAGEFTRRAFENGKLDLTAVEGLADLVMAETEAQRRQAFRQLTGLLGNRAESWRQRLIEALALVEAGIDFSDEGDVPADLYAPALKTVRELAAEISAVLAEGGRGERLRDGMAVAIAGPPNAGKSTLLNRIARREAAIVSPYAGTTRDVIEVHLDLGGYPVTLLDTAGIRESADPVEQEGVRRARERAAQADLVLWVEDASSPLSPDASSPGAPVAASAHASVAAPTPVWAAPPVAAGGKTIWLVWNKIDLASCKNESSSVSYSRNESRIQLMKYSQNAVSKGLKAKDESKFINIEHEFNISALTGVGFETLLAALEKQAEAFLGGEPALITRARQKRVLEDTVTRLPAAQSREVAGREDLLAEELRLAARNMGRLTGRVDVEDILDVIFRDFCIGK